jgi:hypothetical protein
VYDTGVALKEGKSIQETADWLMKNKKFKKELINKDLLMQLHKIF